MVSGSSNIEQGFYSTLPGSTQIGGKYLVAALMRMAA
jgi:hypothetical protein